MVYPNINSAAMCGQILPYLEVYGVWPAGRLAGFYTMSAYVSTICMSSITRHMQRTADFMFGYS